MVVPQLPFGKHKGRALNDPEVPASYLAWMLRECRLGSGLRLAVADELRRRSWNVPEQPIPKPPRCPDCRSAAELRYSWLEDSAGRRRIRVECSSCRRWLGFAAEIEPFISLADQSTSMTAALDTLLLANELQIDLRSDGVTADFATPEDYRRAPARLRELLRQCRYRLGHLMGRLDS
jgi:hypothetical protein